MNYHKKRNLILITFFIIMIATAAAIYIYIMSQPEDEHWGKAMNSTISVFMTLPFLIVELDLLYSALYFIKKEKRTVIKTVFNIIATIVSVSLIISFMAIGLFFNNMTVNAVSYISIFYIVLRLIYFIILLVFYRNK